MDLWLKLKKYLVSQKPVIAGKLAISYFKGFPRTPLRTHPVLKEDIDHEKKKLAMRVHYLYKLLIYLE